MHCLWYLNRSISPVDGVDEYPSFMFTCRCHVLQMGEFVWPDTTQEAIMNAFYWGYVVTQVPSGWLAQRYGGKRVFGFMLLASSLSSALIPAAARTHLFLLLALRFIGGIGAVSDYCPFLNYSFCKIKEANVISETSPLKFP
jgi:MFS family permease